MCLRWLLDNDHDEEGLVVLANLHGGGDVHNERAVNEYRDIKAAVLMERQEGERSYADMFKRYKKRLFIAMSAQAFAQLNGINVISYYVGCAYTRVRLCLLTNFRHLLCLSKLDGLVDKPFS